MKDIEKEKGGVGKKHWFLNIANFLLIVLRRRVVKIIETEIAGLAGGKKALVLDQKDNVAVALADLAPGDICQVAEDGGKKYEVTVGEAIPFGHKFALTDLAADAGVYKYGEEIGKMRGSVKKGGWIHSHNMYCERGM